jgi:hypothetical protein
MLQQNLICLNLKETNVKANFKSLPMLADTVTGIGTGITQFIYLLKIPN